MNLNTSWHIYILKCSDDSYYVGRSSNVENRIIEHNQGKGCDYTAQRRPVELLYVESFDSLDAACNAEQKLKGWSRRKKEAYMKGDWNTLTLLSKPFDPFDKLRMTKLRMKSAKGPSTSSG